MTLEGDAAMWNEAAQEARRMIAELKIEMRVTQTKIHRLQGAAEFFKQCVEKNHPWPRPKEEKTA